MKRRKAGHRRWGSMGGKVPGRHRGDIMSAETRSALMSRIRGKDTVPENLVATQLVSKKCQFDRHRADLPGRPDFVFPHQNVAVFVDGDFWHGYRFPLWKHKLSPKWRTKIDLNRRRDRRNFAKLRRQGWLVIRIWEHQVEADCAKVISRILRAVYPSRFSGNAKASERLPALPVGRRRSRLA